MALRFDATDLESAELELLFKNVEKKIISEKDEIAENS